MGGFPSTVTNESIFRIPVPAKISRQVPEKTLQKQSHVTWLLLIGLSGGPLFVFARKVYLTISPFVTVLRQDRKLIEKHPYLILSRFDIRKRVP